MGKTFNLQHTPDSYVMTETLQCLLQEVLQFYVNHVSVNDFLQSSDPLTEKATRVFLAYTPKGIQGSQV
jgi:hypothetical protein